MLWPDVRWGKKAEHGQVYILCDYSPILTASSIYIYICIYDSFMHDHILSVEGNSLVARCTAASLDRLLIDWGIVLHSACEVQEYINTIECFLRQTMIDRKFTVASWSSLLYYMSYYMKLFLASLTSLRNVGKKLSSNFWSLASVLLVIVLCMLIVDKLNNIIYKN